MAIYPGPSVIPQWISAPATGITPGGGGATLFAQRSGTAGAENTRYVSPTIGASKPALMIRIPFLMNHAAMPVGSIDILDNVGPRLRLRTAPRSATLAERQRLTILCRIGDTTNTAFHLDFEGANIDGELNDLLVGIWQSTTSAAATGRVWRGGTELAKSNNGGLTPAPAGTDSFMADKVMTYFPSTGPIAFGEIKHWTTGITTDGTQPVTAPDYTTGGSLAATNDGTRGQTGNPAVAYP